MTWTKAKDGQDTTEQNQDQKHPGQEIGVALDQDQMPTQEDLKHTRTNRIKVQKDYKVTKGGNLNRNKRNKRN